MIRQLLDRLFTREEINGGERCPTYLFRWTVFQPRWPRALWRGFGIYLHQFVGDDWSLDLHDHPKRFISIGLKGRYVEWTPSPAARELEDRPTFYDCGCSHIKVAIGLCDVYSDRYRVYRAPWIRTFPAEHIHRIALCADRQPCWTLVIVLRSVREWGFWHDGRWIHWKTYVAKGNELADKMRACL